MSTILRNLLVVLVILGVALAAPAAVLFSESFSYPNGALVDVSGGLWTSICCHLGPVDVSDGNVVLLHFTQPHGPAPPRESVKRGFSTLAAGQTIYAGLDVSAAGNSAGVYFAAFMSQGENTRLFVTPFSGSDFTFGIGNENSSFTPTVSWPGGLTFDTTHRVVMSYEFDTGNSKLWVDPTSESSTNVAFTNTASRPLSAFELREYKTPEGTPAATQLLDNLIVGTTFDDVLAVPAPTLPGDYNHDGKVDAADYVVWRKNDGTPEGYDTWRAHFGEPAGSGPGVSANATVPEPTTSVLLFVAAAGICMRRRNIAARVPSTHIA